MTAEFVARTMQGVIVCCSLSIATVFRSRRLLQRVMSMGSFCVQDVHICSFTWKIMRNICASAPTAPAAPEARVSHERSAFRGGVTHTLLLCAPSARNGLGGGPVCNPVSVAEHLFPRMRCELDQDRPARHTEQLDADVDNCPT